MRADPDGLRAKLQATLLRALVRDQRNAVVDGVLQNAVVNPVTDLGSTMCGLAARQRASTLSRQ
jgi:hypothetical protein